jgi:uncharacterized protein
MPATILEHARQTILDTLRGKQSELVDYHPWRRDWQFAVVHSLRVEEYVLKILARQAHPLAEREIILLRLAAILHDLARLDRRAEHAVVGAQIARSWLEGTCPERLAQDEIERVAALIAAHSDKDCPTDDFASGVLQDADTLDEIGAMSIFMAANWVEPRSAFFFEHLRQRLVDVELPFCEKKMAILHSAGAREILMEKRVFIEGFIAQLAAELEGDAEITRLLLGEDLEAQHE